MDEKLQSPPEDTKAQTQSDPDYKELFLRANADLQNFKRRMERERMDWTQLIQAETIEKFLPLVEDLQRALEASTKSAPEASGAWLEGFALILKNLKKKLSELGVEEIVATGTFNPELHEALMQVDSPTHISGNIVQQLEKGYTYKGKVIKHARVSVAK